MLPDRTLQLLTAYVDGELSQRQRKLVTRLLQKSSEARRILKDLQEQSQQIGRLPAHKLDHCFADEVLQAIRRTGTMRTGRPAAWRRPGRMARVAMAASILLAALSGIVWWANRPGQRDQGVPHAEFKTEPELPASRHPHGALIAQVVEGVVREFAQPLPPERPGAKFAFDELAKTQWQEHLVEGMINQQKAVHIDVAVVNHRQAVQRLETVLQNKGIKVVVDSPAQAKLTVNQAKTEYVIYAENVRPDELAAMLYELGTDERARTSIETVTVSNVTAADQKQLSGLLGIEAEELQEPPTKAIPLNQFIPKEGKPSGADTTSDPTRPAVVASPRVAMVMVNEARGGPLSSQIQYFLSQRRQLQPQSLQVIVVVHQA